MRKSGRWMVLVDERILETLDEHGFMTPSEIADLEEIRYSAQHVGDRCRTLADHELVENVGNGVYRITNRGEKYLEGEVDTTEKQLVDDESYSREPEIKEDQRNP